MRVSVPRSSSGFSLIEMVVTIAISSILFLIVGAIMVYSKEAWEKAVQRTAMEADYRYCLRKLEFEMRGASTEPSRSNLLHGAAAGAMTDFFNISGAGSDQVTFQNVDYTVGKYVLNRVRRQSAQVLYESWYFTTGAGVPPTLTFPNVANPPNESLVILENVTSLNMAYDTHAPPDRDAVRINVSAEKTPAFSTDIKLKSNHTFTIRTRMRVQ